MLNTCEEYSEGLRANRLEKTFQWLYPGSAKGQSERYLEMLEQLQKRFGHTNSVALFSAPGRSEIGGNHTDHQHGCVLAAAVTMDLVAAAAPTGNNVIRICSQGYPTSVVELASLDPQPQEQNTSVGLIRGVAAGMRSNGYAIGGFDAVMSSQVPKGSGLSSSAAYEIMVGTILNSLYNNGKISPVELARIGQYSENEFFGKPSGLMDQTACAVGGFAAIDFADPVRPIVREISCNLEAEGYTICIVNAGGSHANLTDEYAAIPAEMRAVARLLGKEVLREVASDELDSAIPMLRGRVSDRAILRALHFSAENLRAQQQADCLERGDIEGFLRLVRQSGDSSERLLQNIYPANGGEERSVALALQLTGRFLGERGAWRVHGGGFAGTIQAFVPNELVDGYSSYIESIFGAGCCYRLSVRPVGGYMLGLE